MNMRTCILVLACSLFFSVVSNANERRQESSKTGITDKQAQPAATRKLPPLPAGVEELKFSDFFKPIGRMGLEYSDKMKSLDGKKVRILGYMVQMEVRTPGIFLFSPFALELNDAEEGLSDYLHPATLHVLMPENKDQPVTYTRGLMLLTGTLTVGPHEEADGRASCARLQLDPPIRKSAPARSPRGLSQISGSSAQ